MKRTDVLLVARHELLDYRRQRQVWVGLFVQPVVFLAVIVFIGWISAERAKAFRTEEFKAAVIAASPRDARPFEEVLRASSFRIVRPRDLDMAIVGKDLEIGLRVPDGAADALAEGRRVPLEVVYLEARDQSEVALARAQVALQQFARREVKRRLASAGLPDEVADPLAITPRDLAGTERGSRIVFSKIIPPMLLFQAMGLIGVAAGRLSGRKDRRTLEPLLLLPLDRRDILAGIGLAAGVVGMVPALTFVVPIVASTALSLGFASGLGSPVGVLAALVTAVPLVAMLLVALGLVSGSMARGAESGSAVAGLFTVAVLAAGLVLQLVDSLPDGIGMLALPILGPAMYAQQAIVDGVAPARLGVAVLATVTWTLLLMHFATRRLQGEAAVVRASR